MTDPEYLLFGVGTKLSHHAIGGNNWILVFPDTYDLPTKAFKPIVGFGVPYDVSIQFLRPPIRIRFWECCVLRTTMPEAPVDKHGDSLPSEGDVRPCSAEFGDAQVDSITKPSPVQLSSNCHLGIGARIANP